MAEMDPLKGGHTSMEREGEGGYNDRDGRFERRTH